MNHYGLSSKSHAVEASGRVIVVRWVSLGLHRSSIHKIVDERVDAPAGINWIRAERELTLKGLARLLKKTTYQCRKKCSAAAHRSGGCAGKALILQCVGRSNVLEVVFLGKGRLHFGRNKNRRVEAPAIGAPTIHEVVRNVWAGWGRISSEYHPHQFYGDYYRVGHVSRPFQP